MLSHLLPKFLVEGGGPKVPREREYKARMGWDNFLLFSFFLFWRNPLMMYLSKWAQTSRIRLKMRQNCRLGSNTTVLIGLRLKLERLGLHIIYNSALEKRNISSSMKACNWWFYIQYFNCSHFRYNHSWYFLMSDRRSLLEANFTLSE